MMFLHENLSGMGKIAAQELTRYAINGINVMDDGAGGYVATATDGKRLLEVTAKDSIGKDVDTMRWAPSMLKPTAAALPNGRKSAVVHISSWAEVFRAAKAGKRAVPGPRVAIAATGNPANDPEAAVTASAAFLDKADNPQSLKVVESKGDFPHYAEIFPSEPAPMRIAVNPSLLAGLLEAAGKVCEDVDHHKVILEFRAEDKPIQVIGENPTTGQKVRGLVMPLQLRRADDDSAESAAEKSKGDPAAALRWAMSLYNGLTLEAGAPGTERTLAVRSLLEDAVQMLDDGLVQARPLMDCRK